MNATQLMGRLTKDVELRYGNSGMAVVGFTLAVNRAYKKEGEERQADFIQCKAFGKTAEFLNNYFAKGSLVAIEGHIQTGSYAKDDGTKVYTTDVIVDKVHFAGGKSTGQGETGQPGFTPVDVSDEQLPF